MKEFIQQSGRDWVAINVDERRDVLAELKERGMVPPVARVGTRWVSGVDLAAVAELIGVAYSPPFILAPDELVARFNLNLDAARSTISEMTVEMFAANLRDRERPMFDVANQVASVMRAFLEAYYDDRHTADSYSTPPEVKSPQDIIDRLDETRRLVNEWWAEDGFDDPLDRVTPTYWGYPTLHEVLEREVWHTTQHLRQLQYVMREHGSEPEIPLTDEHLADLPLPEGIHD